MMHNCPPPLPLLARWLRGAARTNGNYGHILFEQAAPIDDALIDGLRPYFESAHLDAREVFHRAARIDLHPDANGPGGNAQYPNCLPPTAKEGLFGEVIAGLMVEAYQFVGGHRWSIPIFVFRYHAEVEAYIFQTVRKLQDLSIKWRKERAGRNFSRFVAVWPLQRALRRMRPPLGSARRKVRTCNRP